MPTKQKRPKAKTELPDGAWDWLDIHQATVYCGFETERTLRTWVETGRVKAYKPGNKLLFLRADLDAAIEASRVN